MHIPKADGSKRPLGIPTLKDRVAQMAVALILEPIFEADFLDFLGFTFRYDRDLYGSDKTYLNVIPSKKSLKKARDAIREKTGPKKCYKPTPKVVEDLNTYKNSDFKTYDEMLTGKPDAGNPHVRFDEGEQRGWQKSPVALYSTG